MTAPPALRAQLSDGTQHTNAAGLAEEEANTHGWSLTGHPRDTLWGEQRVTCLLVCLQSPHLSPPHIQDLLDPRARPDSAHRPG